MRVLAALWVFVLSLPAYAGVILVPTPPLVADGTTVATVRLYVEGEQYPRVRVKSEDGKVGPVVPGADGTVTFPFTPERATATGTVALVVTSGGADTTINVPVVPPFSGSLSVVLDPPVLAANGTATVRITPSAGSAVSAERRRFLLSASVGTVDTPVPSGSGSWLARYTPPKGLTNPALVVFSAADAAAPEDITGGATLPITIKRSVSLDAAPGSNALLEVGERTYGPLAVSPSGKVAFDVETDPRYPVGTLTLVDATGTKSTRNVDLPAVGQTVVSFVSLTPVVPQAGSLRVRMRVLAPGGRDKTDGTVKVTASVGTISEAKYTNGAWEAVYSANGAAGDATLTAEVDGAKATRVIKVIAGAGGVTLASDPAEISATGTSFKVTAHVKDSTGKAVVGKAPAVSVVSGGSIGAAPKDNGDGSYTWTVAVSKGTNLVRVVASPSLAPSGAGPVRLVAWTSTSTVAANGTDQVLLNVVAVDPFGLPVPDLDLSLGVPVGDGSIAPTAKIGASGVARVAYRAGTKPGLGGIHVEGGGLSTDVPVFQAAGAVAASIPAGGPPDVNALLSRWQGAAPELAVIRAGTAPLSGPPALVQISTTPPYTTPGAAILGSVRVADSAGKGVPSQKLAVTASIGTVGNVTDNHDGTYTFVLQLPPGTDGPVTVSATSGGVSGSSALPKLADAQVAAAPRSTGGGTGGGGMGGSTGGAPRAGGGGPPSDLAKLRLGAQLQNQHGGFTQTGNGGSQLIGEAAFATPGMGFVGVGGDVVYWPVQAQWGLIGLDGKVDFTLQHFQALESSFWNPRVTAMAGGRYRREFGALSVGGGLGVHYLSGVLFRYADAALSEPKLLVFPQIGARLAGTAGVETGRTYAGLELAETFVPFPVDSHVGAFLEYDFQENLGFRVGVNYDFLSMKYRTTDGAGEARVAERDLTINLGTGFVF